MRCDSLLVGCIVYLQSRFAVAYEQRIIVDCQSVGVGKVVRGCEGVCLIIGRQLNHIQPVEVGVTNLSASQRDVSISILHHHRVAAGGMPEGAYQCRRVGNLQRVDQHSVGSPEKEMLVVHKHRLYIAVQTRFAHIYQRTAYIEYIQDIGVGYV